MHTHIGGATKGSNRKRVNYIDTKKTNPSRPKNQSHFWTDINFENKKSENMRVVSGVVAALICNGAQADGHFGKFFIYLKREIRRSNNFKY